MHRAAWPRYSFAFAFCILHSRARPLRRRPGQMGTNGYVALTCRSLIIDLTPAIESAMHGHGLKDETGGPHARRYFGKSRSCVVLYYSARFAVR